MAFHGGTRRPSKRLGQNFLIDPDVVEQIVSSIRPGPSDTILEPGPGHGALTRRLQKEAGKVVAVEKDPALARELRHIFRERSNVTIVEGDILKLGESLPAFNKLVSTPPYYISSKLTLFLADKKFDVASIVFQKEFSERLLAEPGSSEYGRLTVMARRRLDVERILDISRNSFRPRPKVDSTLVRFRPKHLRSEIDERLFDEVVRGIFTQRRRLLRTALLHFLALKYGRSVGRSLLGMFSVPNARVYELSIDELESLSLQLLRVMSQMISSGRLNAED